MGDITPVPLQLTEEELLELQRTLIGRLDLDLGPKIKNLGAKGEMQSLLGMTKLYETNQQILAKVMKAMKDSSIDVPLL